MVDHSEPVPSAEDLELLGYPTVEEYMASRRALAAWRDAQPEAIAAIQRERAARRRAKKARKARERSAGPRFTPQEWFALKEKYGNRCLSCGAAGLLDPDHVVPLALGGRNDISNIQPLCGYCNARKGTTILDYRVVLAPRPGPRIEPEEGGAHDVRGAAQVAP